MQAGSTIDDLCRACKSVRRHTVLVAGGDGRPARVICDYCGSQHNYRGGEREARTVRSAAGSPGRATAARSTGALPLVSETERSHPMDESAAGAAPADLEMLLRRIIREETGLTPVVPAEKWRGGEMVLRPGKEGVQEKSWPIETLFAKVVAVRNRLRVLEQQINGSDLPVESKLKLQGYITGAYGSLTSFNVLFADEDDRFKGAGKG